MNCLGEEIGWLLVGCDLLLAGELEGVCLVPGLVLHGVLHGQGCLGGQQVRAKHWLYRGKRNKLTRLLWCLRYHRLGSMEDACCMYTKIPKHIHQVTVIQSTTL